MRARLRDGATPMEAARAVRSAGMVVVSAEEAREYLDTLAAPRLVHEESGHYLALALPARLPEQI